MYAQPAGNAVRASLESIANKSDRLSEADASVLRERVCVAVCELKAVGWPIERIIVRLKEVASDVGFRPPSKRLAAIELDQREAIWDAMVKQCIEEYYDPKPPLGVEIRQPRQSE